MLVHELEGARGSEEDHLEASAVRQNAIGRTEQVSDVHGSGAMPNECHTPAITHPGGELLHERRSAVSIGVRAEGVSSVSLHRFPSDLSERIHIELAQGFFDDRG